MDVSTVSRTTAKDDQWIIKVVLFTLTYISMDETMTQEVAEPVVEPVVETVVPSEEPTVAEPVSE